MNWLDWFTFFFGLTIAINFQSVHHCPHYDSINNCVVCVWKVLFLRDNCWSNARHRKFIVYARKTKGKKHRGKNITALALHFSLSISNLSPCQLKNDKYQNPNQVRCDWNISSMDMKNTIILMGFSLELINNKNVSSEWSDQNQWNVQ